MHRLTLFISYATLFHCLRYASRAAVQGDRAALLIYGFAAAIAVGAIWETRRAMRRYHFFQHRHAL